MKLTWRELARSAAIDAANRSMRQAGRTAWNKTDSNVYAAEYNRTLPESEWRRGDELAQVGRRR